MRGRIQSLSEDFRLDFTQNENSESTSLPDLTRKHPRLYKCYRRDHDMTDLDDPYLVELMRKGTIPPSLSLRAPPTHIGRSHQRNDILGITKEEVSKRYIIKLRRDRMKNNEAVHKSLDNLPIKIRQVAQKSLEKSPKLSTSTFNSHDKTSDQSSGGWTNNQYAKPLEPLLPSNEINKRKTSIKSKTCSKRKAILHAINLNTENEPPKVTFEPSTFEIANTETYEIPYIFQTGFQGYQNRNKLTTRNKKPITFGQVTNSNEDFQKRYKRVLDSDQNPHFVKSSLIKGQHINNNFHHFGTVYNKSKTHHGEELFAIKSVQKMNDPFIFTSPASPTRVPNPSLYSECQSSDLDEHLVGVSSRSRPNSSVYVNLENSILHKNNDPNLRGNDTNNNMKENENEVHNTTRNIPVLSIELLKVHENATSAQTNKTQGVQGVCNLTDISERDECNLSKTSRSEGGQDMRIAVRINYKSKEGVIEEHTGNISPASKSSKDRCTPIPQMICSSHSQSSESVSSENPLDSLRVKGHLYGEKLDSQKSDKFEGKGIKRKDVNVELSVTNEDTDVPKIVVDLNRLKTVATPSKTIKSNSKTDFKEKQIDKPNNKESESTDKTDVFDKNDDFFLTNNDETDSLNENYTPTNLDKNQETEVKFTKETPRTEIDDSGISVSTFENDAIKC